MGQIDKDQEREWLEPYRTAGEMLSADNPIQRAGGIRILERIIKDSSSYRVAALESLADFLRYATRQERGADSDQIPADILAAVTALRRYPAEESVKMLNLRGAHFDHTDLSNINLRGADLTSSVLISTDFSGADLSGALLREANLTGADLTGAKLRGADLTRALLPSANLDGTDLTDCTLAEADFKYVDISTAIGLPPDLTGKSGDELWHAILRIQQNG
ncbi:pentapeptide repeat-containing protein [Nocardia terpenica]|uniref:pentapeptide repeat-containing protein n=1 Tax=Nocardia terpenica TaxID=455432 RepID=UPI0009EE3AD6|nr:pentapeptide repeat-containing protein [Nocardia terpenica]NQE89552.1 pentapeptide repeat-containing protein [Nocardia terpenica]